MAQIQLKKIYLKEQLLAALEAIRGALLFPKDRQSIEKLIDTIKPLLIEDNKDSYGHQLARLINTLIASPAIHRAILDTSNDKNSLVNVLLLCMYRLAEIEVPGFLSLIKNPNNPIEEMRGLIEPFLQSEQNLASDQFKKIK